MASAAVRVLVADDQEPFRRAARAVLNAMPDFELLGEAASGEEALELTTSLDPDLVLMDINMPGLGGIEATRRIAEAHPGTVVVLLSIYRAEDLPPEARTCGAFAYIHKQSLGRKVLEAVWAGRT